jgi:hypothetical protein
MASGICGSWPTSFAEEEPGLRPRSIGAGAAKAIAFCSLTEPTRSTGLGGSLIIALEDGVILRGVGPRSDGR